METGVGAASGSLSSRRTTLRVLVALGTRPEAIKLAPVIRVASRLAEVELVTLSTGQHESVRAILRLFGLRTDLEARVMRQGQSLASLSARCLDSLGPHIEEVDPDVLLVQGDTTSAVMAALAGFLAGVPVWHVEAGLRTSTPHRPFPEETNRRLISQIATFHFAPTRNARRNLVREGISRKQIAVVGNTGIDSLHTTLVLHRVFRDEKLERFVCTGTSLMVVTTHRRESWGTAIRQIAHAVRELVERFSELQVVYVAPTNPAIKADVARALGNHPRILISDPVDYGDFLLLLSRTVVIVTDSGGIQEEAPSLGIPVLVCREETERVEGVRNGLARIVGTDPSAIFDEVVRILGSTNGAASRKSWQSNPYGDGHAAERIADRLQAYAKSRADRQREHEASAATNQLTALGKRLTHVHR